MLKNIRINQLFHNNNDDLAPVTEVKIATEPVVEAPQVEFLYDFTTGKPKFPKYKSYVKILNLDKARKLVSRDQKRRDLDTRQGS